ncbi:hypothetical protein ABT263_21090 [Kitasatospora sp. NPDC001603]|uniref:hypothetical protein n=1 Tax=Kitasatospora sp. NPDC001603 TaxID=3154388 RepID=UPI0033224796
MEPLSHPVPTDNASCKRRAATAKGVLDHNGHLFRPDWQRGPLVGVRPAYLALATSTPTASARRVLRDARWDPLPGDGVVGFTRGGIRIVLATTAAFQQHDVLHAEGPNWKAVLSGGAPDEITAAVAEALVEAAQVAVDGAPDRADISSAIDDLAEARWSGTDSWHGTDIVRMVSPDRLAEVLCTPRAGAWLVTVGMDGEGWEAAMAGDCPDILVEAVVGFLASESPVRRHIGDLSAGMRRHLDIGPDPDRAARSLSPAARAASPCAPVVAPATAQPTVRRSR